MVARATSQHEAAIALERRFGGRHLPVLDLRSAETQAGNLSTSRVARSHGVQHTRKPWRDRVNSGLTVLLRVHAHRHLRAPRVRACASHSTQDARGASNKLMLPRTALENTFEFVRGFAALQTRTEQPDHWLRIRAPNMTVSENMGEENEARRGS